VPVFTAGVVVACCAPTADAASSTCPGGRGVLQCGERQQILPDSITWGHAYVLDFELFETKTSLPLNNPALNQFWHFEAATAAARGELEFELDSQLTDQNFEQLATVPTPRKPLLKPSKVVTRSLARTLTRLMTAEQQEVVNLEALATALNRATYAHYSANRQDWMRWQLGSAAGFARNIAAAIPNVIKAQKAAASALVAKKLLFGVGTTDLKLAQRRVRKYGLQRGLVTVMQRLGLSSLLITDIVKGFVSIHPTTISFSLSELLSAPKAITREQQFAAALKHFAARTPSAGKPPS
jgi:hypothetical protein